VTETPDISTPARAVKHKIEKQSVECPQNGSQYFSDPNDMLHTD